MANFTYDLSNANIHESMTKYCRVSPMACVKSRIKYLWDGGTHCESRVCRARRGTSEMSAPGTYLLSIWGETIILVWAKD